MKTFHSLTKFISKAECLFLTSIAIIACYLFADKQIVYFLQQYQGTTFVNINKFITNFGEATYYIPAALIGYIASRFILKKNNLTRLFLFILLALVVAGLLCDIIKVVLSRARPPELINNGIYGFQFFKLKANMWSFPSGHATIISVLMVALSLLYTRYWVGFMVILIIVGFSRVIINSHYLSDIIAGYYLGSVITIYIFNQFQKRDNLKLVCKLTNTDKGSTWTLP